MIRVLFVCLGNICRSPMAEAVFRNIVRERRLEKKIEADSAGTGNWHVGNRPHEGTLSILNEKGISSEGMLARQLGMEDEQFHYIVAMDRSNVENIKKQFQHAKLFQLLDFVEDVSNKDVPDPYFTGNFEEVYELVEKGCQRLMENIIKEHELV